MARRIRWGSNSFFLYGILIITGDNRPHHTICDNAPREHNALCGVSTARIPAAGAIPDRDVVQITHQ